MGITVAIRADGGRKAGIGHLMRCMSLAQEIRRSGQEVFFICIQDTGVEMLRAEGFQVVTLPDDRSLPQEAAMVKTIIKDQGAHALIIDTYNVDTDYFNLLRAAVRPVIYIDDLNQFPCPADILVNGNVNADEAGYEASYPQQVFLLGASYNLLRRQFGGQPSRKVKPFINDILITTGGSDPYNLVPQFINWLLELNKHLHIVVGSGFKDPDAISRIGKDNASQIDIYRNLNDLSPVMLQADLAISSGGSTLYELQACGTPTMAFIMADNQKGIVNWLAARDYIDNLGWYDQLSPEVLRDRIIQLENDKLKRQRLADRGQALFDGCGASRVAAIIIKAVQEGSFEK